MLFILLVKCLSGRAKDSTIIISSWDVSPKTKTISIVKKYLLLSRHKKTTYMILNYSLFTLENNKAFGRRNFLNQNGQIGFI
jgi:hypothetical protein